VEINIVMLLKLGTYEHFYIWILLRHMGRRTTHKEK